MYMYIYLKSLVSRKIEFLNRFTFKVMFFELSGYVLKPLLYICYFSFTCDTCFAYQYK